MTIINEDDTYFKFMAFQVITNNGTHFNCFCHFILTVVFWVGGVYEPVVTSFYVGNSVEVFFCGYSGVDGLVILDLHVFFLGT